MDNTGLTPYTRMAAMDIIKQKKHKDLQKFVCQTDYLRG
jgi:hypothetical protein